MHRAVVGPQRVHRSPVPVFAGLLLENAIAVSRWARYLARQAPSRPRMGTLCPDFGNRSDRVCQRIRPSNPQSSVKTALCPRIVPAALCPFYCAHCAHGTPAAPGATALPGQAGERLRPHRPDGTAGQALLGRSGTGRAVMGIVGGSGTAANIRFVELPPVIEAEKQRERPGIIGKVFVWILDGPVPYLRRHPTAKRPGVRPASMQSFRAASPIRRTGRSAASASPPHRRRPCCHYGRPPHSQPGRLSRGQGRKTHLGCPLAMPRLRR
jgi:hypothetical protein